MYPSNLSSVLAVALLAATTLPAASALAQAWPSKPVRMIVPFPPGGSTDIFGRLAAEALSRQLGVQVVVDNRGGAGGNIGAALAARAPADGYTISMFTVAQSIAPSVMKLDFDPVKDFTPITLIARLPSILLVHPSLPVKSVKDLIALAKKRPGSIVYSSSGVGGFPHMSTELFKLMTGTDMLHVPFKGGGPAIADTAAGNTQIHLGSLPTIYGQVKAGRLRIIATGGLKRNPAFP